MAKVCHSFEKHFKGFEVVLIACKNDVIESKAMEKRGVELLIPAVSRIFLKKYGLVLAGFKVKEGC